MPKSDRSDKTARLADSVAIVYKQSKKQKRVYVVLDDLVLWRSYWVCVSAVARMGFQSIVDRGSRGGGGRLRRLA